MQTNRKVKEVCQRSINQDGEGWEMHTSYDLVDPLVMELETLQGMIEELPVHLVIFSLHIKLDSDEAPVPRSSLKVMHETQLLHTYKSS